MPSISLMSFLNILTKGSPQKAQEYGKYQKPGGYRFYWMLRESARSLTVGGKPYAECLKPISQIVGRDVEKECNTAALKAFDGWLKKNKTDAFFDPPIGACTTPGGYLTVKLEPEFGLIKGDQKRIVQLWYSKSTKLSKHSIMLGNHLIKKYLCQREFADCKPGILDLRKKELFTVDPGTPSVLDAMI